MANFICRVIFVSSATIPLRLGGGEGQQSMVRDHTFALFNFGTPPWPYLYHLYFFSHFPTSHTLSIPPSFLTSPTCSPTWRWTCPVWWPNWRSTGRQARFVCLFVCCVDCLALAQDLLTNAATAAQNALKQGERRRWAGPGSGLTDIY